MSVESICALAVGDEQSAANALGGKFQIEACGPLANCDHRVEKYDFSDGQKIYVELYYCSTDHVKTFGIALVVLLVLFFAWKRVRKTSKIVPDALSQTSS